MTAIVKRKLPAAPKPTKSMRVALPEDMTKPYKTGSFYDMRKDREKRWKHSQEQSSQEQ